VSTYYCFSCDDCKLSSGRGFKSNQDRAEALLRVLDCVINVEQADPWFMWQVEFPGDSEARHLVDFAKDHYGHKLRVVDEYSRYSGLVDVKEHSHARDIQ
jgi:hypothetical protein